MIKRDICSLFLLKNNDKTAYFNHYTQEHVINLNDFRLNYVGMYFFVTL